MKETYIVCDKCKYRGALNSNEVISYGINMGKEMDPSGNGYNITWNYVDLCAKCYIIEREKYGKNILAVITW